MKKARNSFFYIGGGISLVMTLLILMGYIWTPYSPTQMDASAQMQAPSLQHLLGTDNLGRDVLSYLPGYLQPGAPGGGHVLSDCRQRGGHRLPGRHSRWQPVRLLWRYGRRDPDPGL